MNLAFNFRTHSYRRLLNNWTNWCSGFFLDEILLSKNVVRVFQE